MNSFAGTIEQIIFYSPDTGYTVLKFVPEEGESMTVIGSFPPLSPGEVLKIKGKWVKNPKYGRQSCLLRSKESRNFSPQA
jgi:exodeoxyribonuclease V alpha subunit